MTKELVIVTGMGAMGLACARRVGAGRQLLLVDNDPRRLEQSVEQLREEGFSVEARRVDLGDPGAIAALGEVSGHYSSLRMLIHTAAVSPTQASAECIYKVNLEGTARLLEVFADIAGSSTVGVVIASMAAQFVSLSGDQEALLATAPVESLASQAGHWENAQDTNQAYMVAKRGNQLRVEVQALRWAKQGPDY